MFFSAGLAIPEVRGSMIEIDRWSPSAQELEYRAPVLA
jgi:hypothetical protein